MAFMDAQPYSSETVIVENGSIDGTAQIAEAFAQRDPRVRVFHNQQRGKGQAVQRGMLEARGKYRFMCDADFSMPVTEVNQFLPPKLDQYDIAIASREGVGAVRYNEPGYRHFVGRAYNLMIRLIALPGLHDTQCGFKCFRGDVAEELFRCQTLGGWSFDVEILYIARLRGYRILEIPIHWHFNPESKVRVLHDSFQMAVDLLHIRMNDWRGHYQRCRSEAV